MELQRPAATPLVTVVCTTYNHEQFIAQTIDGFLAQQCSHPWQILIHDDASTDGTARIVAQYAAQHPDRIRTILQTENQYSRGVDIWQMLFCNEVTSKYIAICEGDDYWIDPLKLQKQLDFMESHPDYGLTYAQARTFNQTTQKMGAVIGHAGACFADILCINPIPTLTTLFRRDLGVAYFAVIQPTAQGWKMGDYPLCLYIAAHSKVHYLAEVVAVYRVLLNSASHSTDPVRRVAFIENAHTVKYFFAERYAPEMTDTIERQVNLELLEYACQVGDSALAKKTRSNINGLLVRDPSIRLRVSVILSHFPWCYTLVLGIWRMIIK